MQKPNKCLWKLWVTWSRDPNGSGKGQQNLHRLSGCRESLQRVRTELEIKKMRKHQLQSKVEGSDAASPRVMGQTAGLAYKCKGGLQPSLGRHRPAPCASVGLQKGWEAGLCYRNTT